MTEMLKDAIFEDSWFEHFGILSVGPMSMDMIFPL